MDQLELLQAKLSDRGIMSWIIDDKLHTMGRISAEWRGEELGYRVGWFKDQITKYCYDEYSAARTMVEMSQPE
jgi:hypothetical protein